MTTGNGVVTESHGVTDADLVPRAAAGDPMAIAGLYSKYWRFAVHAAHRRGAADPEDIAQDVFTWLLEGKWRLNPAKVPRDGNLYSFVKTLVRFAEMKARRPATVPLPEERDPAPVPRDPRPTPEDLLLARERQERLADAAKALENACDVLPRYLVRVAQLRYLRGQSGPDIAKAIGVRPVTIPPYFALVRKQLRNPLEAYRGALVEAAAGEPRRWR